MATLARTNDPRASGQRSTMARSEHVADGELLRAIAEILFCPPVQGLADALGVNRHSVLRWLNGTNPIPEGVWRELQAELATHRDHVAELLNKLESMLVA